MPTATTVLLYTCSTQQVVALFFWYVYRGAQPWVTQTDRMITPPALLRSRLFSFCGACSPSREDFNRVSYCRYKMDVSMYALNDNLSFLPAITTNTKPYRVSYVQYLYVRYHIILLQYTQHAVYEIIGNQPHTKNEE